MQITTILAFITAMGGLEAVKWLVRYITCRKTGFILNFARSRKRRLTGYINVMKWS